MTENNENKHESIAAEMGQQIPFFEATVRRTGYTKVVTIPTQYAKDHHLNDGRRVHVFIVPVDVSPEI